MWGVTREAVALLAAAEGLDLGDELDAVAERLAQLLGFARELDGLVPDETDPDGAFDPRWDRPR